MPFRFWKRKPASEITEKQNSTQQNDNLHSQIEQHETKEKNEAIHDNSFTHKISAAKNMFHFSSDLNAEEINEEIGRKFSFLNLAKKKKEAGRFLVVNASAEAEKNREMYRKLEKLREEHKKTTKQYDAKKQEKIDRIKEKIALIRRLKQLERDAHAKEDSNLGSLISLLSAELESVEDRHHESSNHFDEVMINYMREKRKLRAVMRELRNITKYLEQNQPNYDHDYAVKQFEIPSSERLHLLPTACLSTTNLFGFIYLYNNYIIFESSMKESEIFKFKTSTIIAVRKNSFGVEDTDIAIEVETHSGEQYVFVVPQTDKVDLLYSSLASYLNL
eukprot:gb/GECH01000452.1/.p1 GENE.gb/GECH01000452.1/~~gb/GECH01000452.1/.p1  ORF type:complete len:333 (+),score=103.95 gb/GECH01000452.1/:1-999(+)